METQSNKQRLEELIQIVSKHRVPEEIREITGSDGYYDYYTQVVGVMEYTHPPKVRRQAFKEIKKLKVKSTDKELIKVTSKCIWTLRWEKTKQTVRFIGKVILGIIGWALIVALFLISLFTFC